MSGASIDNIEETLAREAPPPGLTSLTMLMCEPTPYKRRWFSDVVEWLIPPACHIKELYFGSSREYTMPPLAHLSSLHSLYIGGSDTTTLGMEASNRDNRFLEVLPRLVSVSEIPFATFVNKEFPCALKNLRGIQCVRIEPPVVRGHNGFWNNIANSCPKLEALAFRTKFCACFSEIFRHSTDLRTMPCLTHLEIRFDDYDSSVLDRTSSFTLRIPAAIVPQLHELSIIARPSGNNNIHTEGIDALFLRGGGIPVRERESESCVHVQSGESVRSPKVQAGQGNSASSHVPHPDLDPRDGNFCLPSANSLAPRAPSGESQLPSHVRVLSLMRIRTAEALRHVLRQFPAGLECLRINTALNEDELTAVLRDFHPIQTVFAIVTTFVFPDSGVRCNPQLRLWRNNCPCSQQQDTWLAKHAFQKTVGFLSKTQTVWPTGLKNCMFVAPRVSTGGKMPRKTKSSVAK